MSYAASVIDIEVKYPMSTVRSHVVDHLLSRIVERRMQACDQCFNLLWRQASSLPDHFMFIIRIGRVPFALIKFTTISRSASESEEWLC
jgi:hypothetical protein